MAIAVAQAIVNDPAPGVFNFFQAGFGGTSIQAMITDPTSDTAAGSILCGFVTQAYDGSHLISKISDPVNGDWTTVDSLLNLTAANLHSITAYKQNAAPLKKTAATFNANVTAAAKTITLTSDAVGTVRLNQRIVGTGLPANSVLFALNSGTPGLTGAVYQINSQAGFTDQAGVAMTTTDTIMTTFASTNDYQGGVFFELTGGATSGALAGHACQNVSTPGSSADNNSSGTAFCGTSPAMILGYTFNGNDSHAPYAGSAGTGFTNSAGILVYNLGQAIARYEYQRFTNPGTIAATFTSAGSDLFSTFMLAFGEPGGSNYGTSAGYVSGSGESARNYPGGCSGPFVSKNIA